MPQKIFVTFADSRLKPASRRIGRQAKALGVFDRIVTTDENSLDQDFVARFRHKLVFGTRGFGHWIWKPQIILQTLREVNNNDIVLYTDVGCHLNVSGVDRLNDYFAIVEQSESGILAFSAIPPKPPLQYDGRRLPELLEASWTKGDLFDYFGVRDDENITMTPTIGSGIIFLRKCESSVRIIEEWLSVINYDLRLIDDSPSISPNLPGFIEHRHDQAIFAIICKIHNVKCLSAFEYWYPSVSELWVPDWTPLQKFPIHASRDKKLSMSYMVRNLTVHSLIDTLRLRMRKIASTLRR
jgi:hypothetical protein